MLVGVPVWVTAGVGVGVPVEVGMASIGVDDRGRVGVAVRASRVGVAVAVWVGVRAFGAKLVAVCGGIGVALAVGPSAEGRSGAGTRPGKKNKAA